MMVILKGAALRQIDISLLETKRIEKLGILTDIFKTRELSDFLSRYSVNISSKYILPMLNLLFIIINSDLRRKSQLQSDSLIVG